MTADDRRRARQFASEHPDTLFGRVHAELVYVEQLLDAVTRYHPKFDDYRKAMAWKQKYGEEG